MYLLIVIPTHLHEKQGPFASHCHAFGPQSGLLQLVILFCRVSEGDTISLLLCFTPLKR